MVENSLECCPTSAAGVTSIPSKDETALGRREANPIVLLGGPGSWNSCGKAGKCPFLTERSEVVSLADRTAAGVAELPRAGHSGHG